MISPPPPLPPTLVESGGTYARFHHLNPPISGISNHCFKKKKSFPGFLGKSSRDKCQKSTPFPEKMGTRMWPVMRSSGAEGGVGQDCVSRISKSTVKAPVFGTLNSAISNFQTWFVRTVMEVLKYCWTWETSNMQCNYNYFIQIINFHGLFRNICSEVPKNWCLPNTGALTVHTFQHRFLFKPLNR